MRPLLLSLLVCTIVSAACGQDEAALPDSSGRGHSALASGEREQGSGSHPVSPLMLPGEQASRSWVRTALVTSNIPVSIYLIEQLNWGGREEQHVHRSAPHWRTIPDPLAHGFDIAGNSLATYMVTRTLRHAYEFAGYSPTTSLLLAGANVFVVHGYAKYRESQFLGAQKHDLYSAWGGIAFALTQGLLPELERVQYKWIVHNDGLARKSEDTPFIEDYRRQYFFLSVRLGDLLFDAKVLRGLGLSYGGGLLGDFSGTRHYIGLDYDLREILPNGLGEMLNYLHLPLPAVYCQNGVWGFAFSL
ncbi:MAG TPA: hypothetical protein VF889_06895 [Bacteroidota bacterium]